MSHIDERIVKMTFDNSGFEKGISKTTEQLEKLNEVLKNASNAEAVNSLSKSLKDIQSQLSTLDLGELDKLTQKESIWQKVGNMLSSAGKGISDIFSKLDFSGAVSKITSAFGKANEGSESLGRSVDTVSTRFSALSVVGATALANITNGAVNAGKRLLNSLTLEPITTGFSEYETKMNAISTILANTSDEGATLDDVNKALEELNVYADDTIYNFAQMTENIGRFTAAGVNLEDSVAAIKGLSNVAAFFGVDATKASGAMYQMSQALAAGKVQLMDWRSLVNAGMGGEALKDAFVRTSEVLGTGANEMIEKYGSFEESLTKGEWLTGEVLIETLKQISGEYKESELRAQGYSATQAKAIADMAKTATKSATEVRTVTGMLDSMKESVQSGWAISWEHILGNKEQATELLTGVKDAFEALIEPATTARNTMLEFWNQNGGRDAVIKGLSNTFQSLGKVMNSIGDAWKEVFPSMTGAKLVELSNKFKDFTEKLKVSDETASKIKDTFKGVFDVFKTVGSAIGSAFKALTPLTAVFPAIGNAVLSVTSTIGKFVSSLSDALAQSKVFDRIASAIKGAFEGVGKIISNVSNAFNQLFSYIGNLDFSKAFSFIGKGFSNFGKMLEPIISGIGKALGSINFDTIMNAISTASFLKVLQTLKGTFEEVGGIAEAAKGAFSSFKGIGTNIKQTLDAAREALEAWQNNLKADMLLKIAGAVAVLSASLILISSIDGSKLAVALAGMAAAMTELSLAYIVMMKYGGVTSLFSKGIGGSLLAMATSILILAAALKVLSTLDTGEMLTGLTGVLISLGTLAVAASVFDKQANNLEKTSVSLIAFGAALVVMAGALKLLGSIDSEVMSKGLVSLAGLLTELGLFLVASKFGSLSVTSATGILVLSAALVVLSQAVKQLGQINTDEMVKGLVGIAAILAEIALFSNFGGSGLNMIALAAGLTLMSGALLVLSASMKSLGSMQWETIAKGLTSMAGALIVLGTATALISGPQMTLLAVGLTAMSGALIVLGAALKLLGTQSWEEVAVSLVSLAGALTILGVAMYAMTGCIAGAAAMLVMAGALAVFVPQLLLLSQLSWTEVAVGLVALAGAFAVIGAAGYLLVGALPGILGLAASIALFGAGAAAAGAGMALFGAGFGVVAAAIAGSGMVILEFIRQLISLLPQIALKAGEAMVAFAGAVANGAPQIIAAFSTLLEAILTAIQQNIPLIAQTGVEIVVAFAQSLASGIPDLVAAGIELALGVLEGIANNIEKFVTVAADICINFINGIAAKLPGIIDAGINLALSFIEGIAQGISNNQARLQSAVEMVIKAVCDAGLAVLNGAINGFIEGGTNLITGMIDGISSMFTGAVNAVSQAVEHAKQGAANCGTALIQAGKDLINGFVSGISSMVTSAAKAAADAAKAAVDAAKSFLGIRSPSRVFMEIGRYTTEGFSVGIEKYTKNVEDSATNLANTVLNNVKDPLSNLAKLASGDMNVNPVITPVMDLSNIENGTRQLNNMLPSDMQIDGRSTRLAGSVGLIQNGGGNDDIVAALKDLKDNLNVSGPSYTINGITYDNGSNIASAIETLVRAAKIERRI